MAQKAPGIFPQAPGHTVTDRSLPDRRKNRRRAVSGAGGLEIDSRVRYASVLVTDAFLRYNRKGVLWTSMVLCTEALEPPGSPNGIADVK